MNASSSRRRRVRRTVLAVASGGLVLITCLITNVWVRAQVWLYLGDGEIHDCSFLLAPGYKIEFSKFQSNQNYTASYKVFRVPQVPGYPASIYLRFNQPEWVQAYKMKQSVTAVFQFSLYDTEGHLLHSAELPCSTSVWTDGGGEFGIYDIHASKVYFKPGTRYILNVSYTPGTAPPPAEYLYFSIERGCSR
jgi:hypothetical protein